MKPIDQQYRCQVCNEWKVVPQLARECETRHNAREDHPHGI